MRIQVFLKDDKCCLETEVRETRYKELLETRVPGDSNWGEIWS